jgi:hypothetical protein
VKYAICPEVNYRQESKIIPMIRMCIMSHYNDQNKRSPTLTVGNFSKKAIQSFTTDGKKLNSTLGPWTVNHSRSGRWNAYRSKDNKVYQFRINKQNEVGHWNVYTSHGSQLRLVEAVPLDRFNMSDGAPIKIKSLANGTIYGDMTAIVETDMTSKTFYGPDVSWDKFILSQPHWVESLLQDVHFFLDYGYSNLSEIVHKLEEH